MVPDFFIIGAPRCGTTAMYRWLAQHPAIAMARAKECHFFANDLGEYRTVRSWDEYLGLFKPTEGALLTGEASVLYLFSELAVSRILASNPRAKFLVAVRNPRDLVVSWHEQLVATSQEDEESFEKAWRLCRVRRHGGVIPRHCMDRILLDYQRIGQVGQQILRLLSNCSREQVHLVNFADLASSPRRVYLGVLDWLGLADDGFSDFRVINENRVTGLPALQRVWNRSKFFRAVRRLVRNGVGEVCYREIRDRCVKACTRGYYRVPLDTELQAELDEFYRQDRAILKEIFGIHL